MRSSMTPTLEALYTAGLQQSLDAGYAVLEQGGSSLDAVAAAVVILENNPIFNAGRGAVFNHEGAHELDAAIMRGDTLAAGGIAGVAGIRNPILLARAVMEQTQHVLLCGKGAESFALSAGFAMEQAEYFYSAQRHEQWLEALKEDSILLDHSEKKFGTVGAVALDASGNLAAATSTGGMTNKKWGRVGDTPIPGAGTYANNATCAISCTGHGELFIRAVVGHDVSCLMEYGGLSLQEATEKVVMDKLVKLAGEGGLIAIDAAGNIAMPFNSEGMYRGFKNAAGAAVAIYKD